ncbi:hypothetical protein IMZ29_01315 [Achromobacter sp. GG226]|uniref:hypothetical protein n=1 Tax=Verticiella alkaliphila TaxID=2779529 RepID=UPI001C0E6275|nr:hypothetical protein [Verticiella sp. GG226]MBU4609237.1 hypothetical protein [Verticiella sp. GG226]
MTTIVNAQSDIRFTDQLERALLAGTSRKQDGVLASMAGAGRRARAAFGAFVEVYAETRREASLRIVGERLQ